LQKLLNAIKMTVVDNNITIPAVQEAESNKEVQIQDVNEYQLVALVYALKKCKVACNYQSILHSYEKESQISLYTLTIPSGQKLCITDIFRESLGACYSMRLVAYNNSTKALIRLNEIIREIGFSNIEFLLDNLDLPTKYLRITCPNSLMLEALATVLNEAGFNGVNIENGPNTLYIRPDLNEPYLEPEQYVLRNLKNCYESRLSIIQETTAQSSQVQAAFFHQKPTLALKQTTAAHPTTGPTG
jgi:hypothetical protein